ncbi:GNAT family N-acetyltransferase [Mammaliicoccus stepanovicii]|uniref:Mycothiol synthase n=1 Tax=Mammaliicoccus stepanovicii TaxID=643214 RepID=A0A240A560_9STAP|nr:GNAT family N-acetyltransferase [Mammaliicoccus stepanovicii]PNZ79143.1 GNAT family N-acetyltransferase [Mammaliicoccus stepanovicii]GGI39533.1 N-acetyltransferase [Mammaliicoccus stepanovicii]SNV78419.1 mycothiol synthase [Mammaliicoccus stepanovicii]
MERIKLKMIRQNLNQIPQYDLPEGFSIRKFEEGDEQNWAEIETSADEFSTVENALKRFDREFGYDIESMKNRCLFIMNNKGEAIGTTTAWYGDGEGTNQDIGRIHFVAIKQEYQGKKLSKPLLTEALNVIATFHDKVYLTTQTTSYKAINMYLKYGFEPYDINPESQRGWDMIDEILGDE